MCTPPPTVLSSPTHRVESTLVSQQRVASQVTLPNAESTLPEDEDEGDIIHPSRRLRKRKTASYIESSDEESGSITVAQSKPKPKRRRPVLADSDDDGEYNPGNKDADEDALEDEERMEIDEEDAEMDLPSTPSKRNARSHARSLKSDSAPATPTSSSGIRTPNNKFKVFSMSPSAVKRGSSFLTPTGSEKKKARAEKFKEKNEARYQWLVDVRDKEGRSPDDPEYDCRTLKIPALAWKEFTPFEKQFWEIKSNHWDTVVFFKKGKFYELYEKDADIGHQKFDLKLTDRVNMNMVGVPENSFDYWASQFIAQGYKVARVDQMETAVGKAMRDKKDGKKNADEKIIRRELKCVLTAGTLVDAGLLTTDMSTYCMSVKEEFSAEHLPPTFGVCFVDTATAEFNICTFEDDVDRTRFETLMVQVKPKELVLEKGMLSKATLRILKNTLSDPQYNYIIPEKEFWDAETTKDEIRAGGYFSGIANRDADGNETMEAVGEEEGIAIRTIVSQPCAMSALGGLLSYLRTLKLDKELVSARNFHIYDPVRRAGTLVLDGQTLKNLEVFENSTDGGEQGTLLKLLCRCETAFGKRLFKRWICHPLRSTEAINDRLDAVEDFEGIAGQQGYVLGFTFPPEKLQLFFRKLPDLERIISRIHSKTCRVKDFVIALGALEEILRVIDETEPFVQGFRSKRLRNIFSFGFPTDLRDKLQWFQDAFDHRQALEDDNIKLHKGYDDVYDAASNAREEIDQQFEEFRREYEKKLKCKVQYKDMGKELFTIEVPSKVKVPADWSLKSKTQSVTRYWSPRVERLVKEFQEARETEEEALRNIKARMCEKFDQNYEQWLTLIKNVAELDCLMGLARCRRELGEPLCRPEFVEDGPSVLELEELRHPCILPGIASSFIPNDTNLGGDKANMILLTGPNMGGKSTLLRQTCIAVIMAQLGSYVPARSCRMTPFDRIFTRIGANDNILAGQSTFMVELSETSKILREATPRSLVILDELGRGTSTFDGYAIAYSVLHHLTTHVQCLGLFSTHYGMLTKEFESNPLVALMYMDFFSDEERREVTFLYKLKSGSCPKSYGMNVASMAGVPHEIVDRAESVAAAFEKTQKIRQVHAAE
ncbi:DNA mismatch repair protein msh6 [Borealophlyctis nickersoniae]|nr:DNA mismatch repair protein msh6 [Borealophlyctis nickersoniae]